MSFRSINTLVCCVILFKSFVNGGTINVPCCATSSIASALGSAANGDTVALASGTFAGACVFTTGVSTLLTIAGSSTTLSCTGAGFSVGALGMTLQGVDMRTSGAGSVAVTATNPALLIIDRCSFSSWGTALNIMRGSASLSAATFNGQSSGAIVVAPGQITITTSTFTSNTAQTGGALYLTSTSSAKISSSQFSNNVGLASLSFQSLPVMVPTGSGGGAIFAANNTLMTVSMCQFRSNTASGGAAMFLMSSSLSITDTILSKNFGRMGVGALVHYANYSLMIARNLTVVDNTGLPETNDTVARGSGITILAFQQAVIVFSDSLFTNNSEGGMAVLGVLTFYYSTIDVTMTNTRFIANTLPIRTYTTNWLQDASGLRIGEDRYGIEYIEGGVRGIVRLSNLTFSGNVAYGSALMLYLWCNGPTTLCSGYVNGSTFTSNKGSFRGGGAFIYSYSTGIIQVNDTSFRDNSAVYGGAMVIGGPPDQYVLSRVSFVNNSGPMLISTGGTVMQTTFVNATNPVDGGGCFQHRDPYNQNSCTSATLVDVDLTQCTSAQNGGGISSQTGGNLFLTRTRFTSCSSLLGDGGGVATVVGVPVVMKDVTFQFSRARNGGVLYGFAKLTITGTSYFANNYASANGGAIVSNDKALLTICGGTFTGNQAGGSGGALYTGLRATVSIYGSPTFLNNSALASGGSVYIGYAVTALSMSGGITNSTARDGGGLYIGGGGIYVPGIAVQFTSNTATNSGGGLYTEAVANINNCKFNANVAQRGGGLFTNNYMTISYSAFSSNTASRGGGIDCYKCNITLSTVNLARNVAATGSAFLCDITGGLQMSGVTTNGNQASENPMLAFECSACGCCSLPASPANITQLHDAILSVGRKYEYTCDTGYSHPPNDGIACANILPVNDTQYSPQIPCTPTPCSPYGLISHATSDILTSPHTGDTLIFTCDNGYQFAGNDRVTCIGPKWIGQTPACVASTCPDLNRPAHGTLSAFSGVFGDVVTVSCDLGYFPSVTSISCLGTAWSSVPVCNQLSCPQLAKPAFGTIEQPTTALHGDTAQITCDAGYLLSIDTPPVCFAGNWTSVPTCQAASCAQLEALENGEVVNGTGFTGDQAFYVCDVGYYLVGVAIRSCVGPSWLGAPPTCQAAQCNATIGLHLLGNCSGPTTHGDVCELTCAAGSASTAYTTDTFTCRQTGANSATATFVPALPICTPCDLRSYAPPNSTTCTPCTNGRTNGDAGAESDCLCDGGYYDKPRYSGKCIPCPEGALCSGGHEPAISKPGFYSLGEAYVACTPAFACIGNDSCEVGYSGSRCGACAEGFYQLNGQCRPFPTDLWWRIMLLVLAAIGVGIALIQLVKPSPSSERTLGFTSMTIGLSFGQVIAVFAVLKVPWQRNTSQAFDVSSTLNLNIEIAAPECLTPIDFFGKFRLTMLIPLAVLGIMIVACALLCVVAFLRKGRSIKALKGAAVAYIETTAAAYLSFLTMAYLFLAKTSLSAFACTKQPDGTYGIVGAPGDHCYDPSWTAYASLGTFGILFYIIGIPVAVNLVFIRNWRRHGIHVARHSLASNFFVSKYKDRAWFWETMVLVRKLLIVVITVIVTDNAYRQIVLCAGVALASLIANLSMAPYRWVGHNRVENTTLAAMLAILLSALFLVDPHTLPEANAIIDITTVVVICISAAVVVIGLALEIKVFRMVGKIEKQLKKDKTTIVKGGPILAIDFDSALVATFQKDYVKLLDTDTLTVSNEYNIAGSLPFETIKAVSGNHGFYTWHGNTVQFWDRAGTHTEINASAAVTCLSVADDIVVAGLEDGHALVFDLMQKPPTRVEVPCHAGAITAVCASDLFFITAGIDGRLRTWKHENHAQLREWNVGKETVSCIAESHGRYIYGTTTGAVCVQSLTDGSIKGQKLRYHKSRVEGLAIAGDIAVSYDRHSIVAFDLNTGAYLQTIVSGAEIRLTALTATMSGKIAYADDSGKLVVHYYNHAWDIPRLITVCKKGCCARKKHVTVGAEHVDLELEQLLESQHLPKEPWMIESIDKDNVRLLAVALDARR